MDLFLHGQPVPTVFHLRGGDENDMTAAFGFVLSRSPIVARAFLGSLFGTLGPIEEAAVTLQTRTAGTGITDIEIRISSELCVVIEAKRGPNLPEEDQLQRYAEIVKCTGANQQMLVAITNATREFAEQTLPKEVTGIPLVHRSWREIKALVECSMPVETRYSKRLLAEFVTYLEGLVQMETRYSNMAFVVSLGAGKPDGWGISWIDIVEKRKRYFYPVGSRWPEPPNYIAFRYAGHLQSIHHLGGYEIITEFNKVFPEAAAGTSPPHYCFWLGPPIRPVTEVKNGPRIRQANHCWCMLDTLLTSKTISAALDETEKRLGG